MRSEKLARIEYCTEHTFRVFLKVPQLEAPVLKRRLHQRYLFELNEDICASFRSTQTTEAVRLPSQLECRRTVMVGIRLM